MHGKNTEQSPPGTRTEWAYPALVKGLGLEPGAGLLVMEVQETILHFLLQCAEIILHDLRNAPAPSVRTSLPLSQFPLESGAKWPSVAAAVTEMPYRVPVFDISRLQTLVNAKRAEAEDHLWSLQEDPGYFQNVVADYSEHRMENLLSVNGKRHPHRDKPIFWNDVFHNVLIDAFANCLMWDLAQKEILQLSSLRTQYATLISSSVLLPEEYERALHLFYRLIKQFLQSLVFNFKQGIVSSQPLRGYYIRGPFVNGDVNCIIAKRKNPENFDYFLWLIDAFKRHGGVDISVLLDELERVTRSQTNIAGAAQNQRITAWISAMLSDLAVLSEIERQLDLHEPRFMGAVSDDDFESVFTERIAGITTLMEVLKGIDVVDTGTPLAKFNYPSGKQRTAATTEKMREAERNLDIFWQAVNDHYIKRTGKTYQEHMEGKLTPRVLERTPEWTQPNPRRQPEKIISADALADNFSILDIDVRPTTIEIALPKIKVKTRGPATELPKQDVDVSTVAPQSSPTITVTKRAHEVFSSIFYNPMHESPPGEIPWVDFLHALSSAGFAVEKHYGSAWIFTPSKALQRPVIFHEPHPGSKIPIHIARRHGRRLYRAYGWTTNTFVTE